MLGSRTTETHVDQAALARRIVLQKNVDALDVGLGPDDKGHRYLRAKARSVVQEEQSGRVQVRRPEKNLEVIRSEPIMAQVQTIEVS
jgi:hypothetical protein